MRDLYATTMSLVHVAGGSAYEVAVNRALAWAWRLEEDRPSLSKTPSGRAEDAGAGVVVEWASLGSSSSTRAIEIKLQHPDSNDPTLRWLAVTEVTEIGGATKISMRLALGASVYALKPLSLSVRAPVLVQDLMRAPLRAYAGSMELEVGPRDVRAQGVSDLIDDVLRAEGRALPVLIASSEVELPLASALAKAAAGLTQLVRAHDDNADRSLEAALKSSGFTIPRGGLRLFWPDFDLAGEDLQNPYWTAAQLRAGRARRGPSVVNQVVRMLAPISAARVPPDRAILRVRREALRQRQAEQQAREEAQKKRARRQREAQKRAKKTQERRMEGDALGQIRGQLDETKARLDQSEKEHKDAEERAAAAAQAEAEILEEAIEHSDRADRLETEAAGLRQAMKTMNAYKPPIDDEADAVPIPDDLDDWSQIVEHLDELEGPGFVLTELARSCADGKSRYPRPNAIWEGLRALEKVGRAYNEMGADIGMRFEDFAMEQAEIEVALQDSSYPDCWFEYEDRWYERVPHVKLDDAKSSNEVGRIYFALDSDGRRVIVDWFGTKPDRPNSKRADRAVA